ncbi:hypothetical protein BC938DRAFT_473332 [Jimgerdemannia flammicorona]|uniref:Uncharacterized protein n=1 Tax=Jimgerdemannia flammicorona TaxID=994334 RepID=A0A433Q4M0_9FUNG|nr:hypothetical protein BC938DRAFT_473332 [Jimgerdemannia flammicorona]
MAANQKKKPKSALDTIVNGLVRAAVGGNTASVPDADLDKYVADLILKEAAAKNKNYNKIGVRAYLPDTGRFLLNIVKATDDHNQTLIRQAQEQAAEKLREARREDEQRRDEYRHRHRDRDDGRRGRSPSPSQSRSRSRSILRSPREKNRGDDERTERDASRSRNRNRSRSRSRSRSPAKDYTHRRPNSDDAHKSSARPRSPSVISTPSSRDGGSAHDRATPSSSSPEPVRFKGRGAPTAGASRMDRYFQVDYDPSKDTTFAMDEDGWTFDFAEMERSVAGETGAKERKKAKKEKKKKKKKSGKRHRKHDDGEDSDEERRKRKKKRRDTDSDTGSIEPSEDGSEDGEARRQRRRRDPEPDSDEDDRRRRKSKKDKRTIKKGNEDEKKGSNAGGGATGLQYSKGVREWDVAKLASGAWG